MNKFLLILILFFFTFSISYSFTDCAIISSPGSYTLTSNIIDSTNSTCFNITSSDVELDCLGNLIDGSNLAQVGISAIGLNNITINNCNLRNWGNTSQTAFHIYLNDSNFNNIVINDSYFGFNFQGNRNNFTNIDIFNVTTGFNSLSTTDSITGNRFYDIDAFNSLAHTFLFMSVFFEISLNSFENINIYSPSVGGFHFQVFTSFPIQYNSFENIYINDSGFEAIHLFGTATTSVNNNNFTNIEISNSASSAIHISDSQDNIFTGLNLNDNFNGVYFFGNSDNNEFLGGNVLGSSNFNFFFDDFSGRNPDTNFFTNLVIDNLSSISSDGDDIIAWGNNFSNNIWIENLDDPHCYTGAFFTLCDYQAISYFDLNSNNNAASIFPSFSLFSIIILSLFFLF